jgi:hypothetical protein
MRSKLLPIIIFLTFLPTYAPARDEPERVAVSRLSSRSFVVGGLRITLRRFWAGVARLHRSQGG